MQTLSTAFSYSNNLGPSNRLRSTRRCGTCCIMVGLRPRGITPFQIQSMCQLWIEGNWVVGCKRKPRRVRNISLSTSTSIPVGCRDSRAISRYVLASRVLNQWDWIREFMLKNDWTYQAKIENIGFFRETWDRERVYLFVDLLHPKFSNNRIIL